MTSPSRKYSGGRNHDEIARLSAAGRHRGVARAGGRGDAGSAHQCRQGAAELADEPSHLRWPALLAARQDQQGATSRTSSSPMRSPSAARRRTRTWKRRRSPRTASSTSSISGACSTRSTAVPATSAASSGAWTRAGEAAAGEPRRRAVGQSGHHAPPTIRRASSRTNKETGKVVWETNLDDDQPDVQLTAAPLAVKDKIIVGAAGGDRGVRDWIAALDAATGKLLWRKYVIPAPGEPGSETWKDKNNAWQTGGGAMWVTGSYDVATNQVIWGTGNPVPMFDATYRPGDNLFTNSVISWNPDSGKMNWYFQYTPGDHWDYDEAGTHILIDGQINGQARKLITHSARNGFLYTMERDNGQTLHGQALSATTSTGPRASTRRPASRSNTIPNTDVQMYAGTRQPDAAAIRPRRCARRRPAATITGRRLQPEDQAALHPGADACVRCHAASPSRSNKDRATGRAAPTSRRALRDRLDRRRPADRRDQEDACTCRIRTTAARLRPAAAWCSRATPTARSPPTTTPRSTSSGRSMSASASTRRR